MAVGKAKVALAAGVLLLVALAWNLHRTTAIEQQQLIAAIKEASPGSSRGE